MALQVDKVARIWISYLFQVVCRGVKNEALKKVIQNAVGLPESIDVRIIQIVQSESMENSEGDLADQDELARKDKVKTLKRRINELKKFKELNEYLIGQYGKELNDLEG